MQTTVTRAPVAHAVITKDVDVSDASSITEVWNPASGKRVVLIGWTLTSSAAVTLKLVAESDSAANRVVHIQVAANGGESRQLPHGAGIYFDEDENIEVLTSAAAAVKGTLYGYEV
ncbi:MAG: hypothetical protein ACPHCN_08405 [Mycobacterium sp.]